MSDLSDPTTTNTLQRPVYAGWEKVPPRLRTKTSWAREGFMPSHPEAPDAWCQTRRSRYPLYSQASCVNKPRTTRTRKDWPILFSDRYGYPPLWGNIPAYIVDEEDAAKERAILIDACAALFSLNRYAKHDACSWRRHDAIYTLKNRLLRCLFLAGYCVRAFPSKSPDYDGECYPCQGSGRYVGYDGDYDDHCAKCDGTGRYFRAGKPYWSFVFAVGDPEQVTTYCWHQPAHLAPWAKPVGEQPSDPAPVTVEKNRPLDGLALRRIPEALALLEWVCDNAELRFPLPMPPATVYPLATRAQPSADPLDIPF